MESTGTVLGITGGSIGWKLVYKGERLSGCIGPDVEEFNPTGFDNTGDETWSLETGEGACVET